MSSTKLCRTCGISPCAKGRADCLRCRKVPDAARRAENPYGQLLAGAMARGVECTITERQYLKMAASEKCFYCRRALGITGHRLDRKDSTGGYTVKNCVPSCWPCNRAKGANISFKEFRKMQFPVYSDVQRMEVWNAEIERRARLGIVTLADVKRDVLAQTQNRTKSQ
jgi:hypothetical protein